MESTLNMLSIIIVIKNGEGFFISGFMDSLISFLQHWLYMLDSISSNSAHFKTIPYLQCLPDF